MKNQIIAKINSFRFLGCCLFVCFLAVSVVSAQPNQTIIKLLQESAALIQAGNFSEAEPRLRRAVSIAPTNSDAHNLLGIVFDQQGKMLASAKTDITMWRETGSIVEQSSTQIWQAVCHAVRAAVGIAAIDPRNVAGIGVDATCSLVVLGAEAAPLPVGPSGDPERNVIVWMDHRAVDQAERINATGHDVLRFVGGVISPEMETPKLLWLRENRPDTFDAATQFFDLADFLTWRATGSLARSVCTLTCKWTYFAHEARWDESYFHPVGLGVLADEGFARIGTEVVTPGTALGHGLTAAAAADLGLLAGTPVAAGLIDAHAGGVGTVGAGADVTNSMAYVFGTSSCTMTTTIDPVFLPGVWGPYFAAMIPGMWLNEGGNRPRGPQLTIF